MSHTTKQIRNKFSSLTNRKDVAALLEVSWERLRYHLYRQPNSERYFLFTIPKKSGTARQIHAPNDGLKSIQRKLLEVLEAIYTPRSSVHGFTANRSILTNATIHKRSRHVLNVDLADFFPTINFGRVRGLFLAQPYTCTASVATTLAQICCYQGSLPQGAPTSPAIANMICSRLDRQLQSLAKFHRCQYTRYADDISFSNSMRVFPKEIASLQVVDGELRCVAGVSLGEIITSNGFSINDDKIRLQDRHQRQEVTGLTTNISPNVPRSYVRQIRAMLHAWSKFGIEDAQKEYLEKYFKGHRNPNRPAPDYRRVVRGKIEYLGMIRGKSDPIFLRFMEELRVLAPDLVSPQAVNDPFARIMDNLVLIETYEGNEFSQGTAFLLEGVGFVTCAHVLGTEARYSTAFTRHNRTEFPVEVIWKDEKADLALLKIEMIGMRGLKPGDSRRLKVGDATKLAGFPNHNFRDSGILSQGAVIGRRHVESGERLLISQNIIFGNSGGPVLDVQDKVIGVAVTGAADEDKSTRTVAHGVIPISAFLNLAKGAAKPRLP